MLLLFLVLDHAIRMVGIVGRSRLNDSELWVPPFPNLGSWSHLDLNEISYFNSIFRSFVSTLSSRSTDLISLFLISLICKMGMILSSEGYCEVKRVADLAVVSDTECAPEQCYYLQL